MDRVLGHRIVSLSAFLAADTILLYAPIQSEPNLLSVAEAAFRQQKQVAFPRCQTDTCTLRFYLVHSLSELTVGAFGIVEPREGCQELLPQQTQCSLCIVPALAYDRSGFRIGYGKGYYDRFLPHFSGISMGAVYSTLLLETLPKEPTDQRVEWIVTEKEVRRVHG